jgi:hypothetical protein
MGLVLSLTRMIQINRKEMKPTSPDDSKLVFLQRAGLDSIVSDGMHSYKSKSHLQTSQG